MVNTVKTNIAEEPDYNGLVDYIINEEGFLESPTDIGDGKITLGSGLTDPRWHALYRKKGNKWSEEDNRMAVEEEVRMREKWLADTFPNWELLPRDSQEALIAYKYNYNFTPTNSPKMYEAARNKDFVGIGNQINATSKDPKFKKGLETRRAKDRSYYFSGFSDNSDTEPTTGFFPQINHIETPDAIRHITPVIRPSQRGDVKKAMQDKVDYHNFMNNISIQNNPQPVYNPPIKFDNGGNLTLPKIWNDLSMAEKADMMKVAILNGITTLPEIRDRYNEFAKGGYAPSENIKRKIEKYEGKAMTGAIDPLSGKWAKNNSFESEARGFYNALPEDIREQVLSNPELADSLYSYSYNVGAGNFKKRVVPALRKYYQGEGSVADIEKSMWASGDSKLRGLQRRRADERAGVRRALNGESYFPIYAEDNSDSTPIFIPSNPKAFFSPLATYDIPTAIVSSVEEPLVQAADDYAYSKEVLDRQERMEKLNNFNMLMSMMNPIQSDNSLIGAINMLKGNSGI